MATKTTKKTATKKVTENKEAEKINVSENEAQNITVNLDTEKIAEAVATAIAPAAKETTSTYGEEDLILCQSITRGELIYIGAKSGNRYVFADHGDTCEIEVRDLNALRASKSQYLYAPLFVIIDDDFVSQPNYKEVNSLYNILRKHDINEMIDMPLAEFKKTLASLPDGLKKVLEEEVATRIHNDEFDSLSKIKAIDEICGTDLRCMIE